MSQNDSSLLPPFAQFWCGNDASLVCKGRFATAAGRGRQIKMTPFLPNENRVVDEGQGAVSYDITAPTYTTTIHLTISDLLDKQHISYVADWVSVVRKTKQRTVPAHSFRRLDRGNGSPPMGRRYGREAVLRA